MVRINKTQYAEPRTTDQTQLIQVMFSNSVALEWTNQPATVTELFATAVNRKRLDLRPFSQYRIVVTLTDNSAAANSILGVQYSLDNSQFVNLSDGVDDTLTAADCADIDAASGIIAGAWANITDAAKVDAVALRIAGNSDAATGDPDFTHIEVQYR